MNTYIHRYVVDFVLTEWFKMTMPEETAIYVASAEGWLDRFINEARDVVVKDVIFRL